MRRRGVVGSAALMTCCTNSLTIGVEKEVPDEVRSLRVDKMLPWGISHFAAMVSPLLLGVKPKNTGGVEKEESGS